MDQKETIKDSSGSKNRAGIGGLEDFVEFVHWGTFGESVGLAFVPAAFACRYADHGDHRSSEE